MATRMRPAVWTPAEVRAWVDRHGGNVSALARLLHVPRTRLHDWMREDGRAVPGYVQAHMETIDRAGLPPHDRD